MSQKTGGKHPKQESLSTFLLKLVHRKIGIVKP